MGGTKEDISKSQYDKISLCSGVFMTDYHINFSSILSQYNDPMAKESCHPFVDDQFSSV